MKELTLIDLFCGCGGFTLGMLRSGFRCLAAIDIDRTAIATLKANLPDVDHPLERDLTRFTPEALSDLLGTDRVDVIVGGPPCQGFSTARQVDGANHGTRLKADPRRYLYRDFLRFVDFFQPRVFVLENVLGIRTAAGGEYFTRLHKESRELGHAEGRPGYRVHGQVEDAWELGVPQKRRRQLVIGVRNDLSGYFLPELKPAPRARPHTPLGAAIGDLPILRAGGGVDERDYDVTRVADHIQTTGEHGENYLLNVVEIERAGKLTNHHARPHSVRDLRDFALLKEGESSAIAMRERGVKFEFPYDKSSFKDRYTRQSRSGPCSTIVAHLSKDGLMFIHPTQTRSLTPREAARVQSFPDWFRFPPARTPTFRLIGNAVPPLIAEAVGLAVRAFIEPSTDSRTTGDAAATRVQELAACKTAASPVAIPGAPHGRIRQSHSEALRELEHLTHLDRRALRTLHAADFLRGWHALLFLLPELHPENARDHGHTIETISPSQVTLRGYEGFLSRRYARSGWPVALRLLGREAWRRYVKREITDADFYCVEAQKAGIQLTEMSKTWLPGRK